MIILEKVYSKKVWFALKWWTTDKLAFSLICLQSSVNQDFFPFKHTFSFGLSGWGLYWTVLSFFLTDDWAEAPWNFLHLSRFLWHIWPRKLKKLDCLSDLVSFRRRLHRKHVNAAIYGIVGARIAFESIAILKILSMMSVIRNFQNLLCSWCDALCSVPQ